MRAEVRKSVREYRGNKRRAGLGKKRVIKGSEVTE